MGLRKEGLQILFGSVGMGLALQFGLIKPQGSFLDNVLWSGAVMLSSRFLALVFGGRGK
jgi:hypothetical protein